MSDRSKRIFLALSIVVPFLAYTIYYYSIMVKNAPYKFSEFESLTFKYGPGDSLVNVYNSQTGVYTYVNNRDSLVTRRVKLNKDDLLYLHRKAADLGFWNFPEEILSSKKTKAMHYYFEMKYERKTKHMYFDAAYDKNQKLQNAAKILTDEVNRTINDAESRGRKY